MKFLPACDEPASARFGMIVAGRAGRLNSNSSAIHAALVSPAGAAAALSARVPFSQNKRAAEKPPSLLLLSQESLAGGFARRGLGLLLGLEVLAGDLVDRLHRQPRLAAIVEAEQLNLDLVAFLDDVGGLLHAVRRELADVDEAVLGAEEVHEGAELHHLDHGAVIDLADLRIGGDRLDPLDRGLDGFAIGGSDLHGAVVVDVDLGARLLDDFADHLAAGADHFADLVG